MKHLFTLCLLTLLAHTIFAQTYSISGEQKKWHKITLTFDGPSSSETAPINPFADYKFDVTFTNGSKSYTVPGYFAADGNAAETSATSGNKWNVHFAPDTVGTWNFTTTFYKGTDVAVTGTTDTTGILHNITGSFSVNASDKTGRDLRGKGRLTYVGEQYLMFLEDETYFYKAGADAPENTLAYEDFDDVPNRGNRRKDWQPHQQDYNASTGAAYTWQNGKGTELLGVIDYLSGVGVNAFSFLTFSLSGDDENVFPHLLKVDISTYNSYGDAQQWNDGVYHDRFDISRMAQWEKIFEYADLKGMYLHFKTQETENDQKMDGGEVDRERKLYYRELIARFSHHLALNWNTGEENTQTAAQEIAMAAYLHATDPYRHNTVMHTYPGQHDRYHNLVGSQSEYTGASLQTSNATYNELFGKVEEWVGHAKDTGKKWIVAVDEPGNASIGIDADPDDRKLVRSKVLWATMMAGGAGVEYYYGYQSGCGDLLCQDHRSRAEKYEDAAFAIQFFENELQDYLPIMYNANDLTSSTDDYAMTNGSDAVVVYLPDGGSTNITLDQNSTWTLNWYNPRNGDMGTSNEVVTNFIAAPDENDWVALITRPCPSIGSACDDGDSYTANDSIGAFCNCVGEPSSACPPAGTSCDDGDADTFDDIEDGNCNCTGISHINIPGIVQAEDFYINYGTTPEPTTDVDGGENLGYINNGDSTVYKLNITNAGNYTFTFRVASNTQGGSIDFHLDTMVGTVDIENTGGWQSWQDIIVNKTISMTGTFDLVLKYSGGSGYLFNLNYVEFTLTSCNAGTPCDDNDPNTINDVLDMDCNCAGSPATFTTSIIEAEDAQVGSKWTEQSDPMACGAAYLLPPNTNSMDNPPSTTSDWITFSFDLEEGGVYKVFARTFTPGEDSNSFWVRANAGTWLKWNKINSPNKHNEYRWSQVGDWSSGGSQATPVTFDLIAGTNTVDFAWREPGTRLDKIFVTTGDLTALNVVQNNTVDEEFSFKRVVEESCPLDTVYFSIATDGIPFPIGQNTPMIDHPITIMGNGVSQTVLDGNDEHLILINNSSLLSLHNLKMTQGFAPADGGAFVNNGTIRLSNVELSGNHEGVQVKTFTNNGTIIVVENTSVTIKE